MAGACWLLRQPKASAKVVQHCFIQLEAPYRLLRCGYTLQHGSAPAGMARAKQAWWRCSLRRFLLTVPLSLP